MSNRIQWRRPSAGTVLGGLALVVATSGVALAAIPGGDATVTACVSTGGVLRAVDAEQGETCPANQATVKLASTDADGKVADADRLDGMDSTDFLNASAKAADADLLDGMDSTAFLGAGALPAKVSRHWESEEIPAGATRGLSVVCAHPDAVAVGGGVHWGTGPNHVQIEENITGIVNASDLGGDFGWNVVVTNDETLPLDATATVICLNP